MKHIILGLTLAFSVIAIALALTAGCATSKSAQRTPEATTIVLQEPPNTMPKFGVTEGVKLIRLALGFGLRELSKDYEGQYGASVLSPNAVQLTPPLRTLHKQVVFERTVADKPAAKFVATLTPVTPPNSAISYFQILPEHFDLPLSKAKATNFLRPLLHADRLNVTIEVQTIFPDGRQPGGLAKYVHVVRVSGIIPGESRVLTQPSPIYEVPSEGPVTVTVTVTEVNQMAGWLRWLAGLM